MSKLAHFAAGFVTCAALVVAVGWLAAVKAQEWATLACCSYHFERHGQNQTNPGVGFEHVTSERWRLVGGVYDNSSNATSFYAGGVYTAWRAGAVSLGATLGLATGYGNTPLPILGPSVSLEGERFGLNLLIVPSAGGVAALQFKVRW